jgi:hypothetical protein
MNSEFLIETWTVLSEYIKDKQLAADQWISILLEHNIDQDTLDELADHDVYLENAINVYIENEDDEDDNIDEW